MSSRPSELSPLRVPFQVHPSVQIFLVTPPVFLTRHFAHGNLPSDTSRPHPPTFLAVGAIVFDRQLGSAPDGGLAPPPRVLLLQRAAHDSMPLLWETPGGGCDDDDVSVLHSCARELKEEAGLEAISVGPPVRCSTAGVGFADEKGPGQGGLERGEEMGSHMFFTRKGKLVSKFYFVVEAKQTNSVVVDPTEHTAYIWATEEEVSNQRMQGEGGKSGMELKFTTDEQRKVILEAFNLWKDTNVE